MLGDKLYKQLQATYEKNGQFDPEEQIEIQLKSLVKKVQIQFKKMKGKRIHISYTPFTIDTNKVVAQPTFADKPEGIWYGISDSWIKDVISGIPEWLATHAYVLEVDESKIKKISKFGMDIFVNEFGDEDYPQKYKWDKMAKMGYMGAETVDPIVVSRLLHTWATISGCIWDPKCIKSMNEIKLDLTDKEMEFVKLHANKRT
jgi:hypothetical protein